jgi:predicted CopG family antitoxin
MAQKPIQVTEEAYNRLKEHKRDSESFSDVILRVVPKKVRSK